MPRRQVAVTLKRFPWADFLIEDPNKFDTEPTKLGWFHDFGEQGSYVPKVVIFKRHEGGHFGEQIYLIEVENHAYRENVTDELQRKIIECLRQWPKWSIVSVEEMFVENHSLNKLVITLQREYLASSFTDRDLSED